MPPCGPESTGPWDRGTGRKTRCRRRSCARWRAWNRWTRAARLIGVEAHRHDAIWSLSAAILFDAHRIPDELARRRPGKVPHILGAELPGRCGTGAAALIGACFIRRDDKHRFLGGFGLFQTLALGLGQDGLRVLQLTGRRHHEILRHGDGDIIVAEFQRELATPQEGLVVPAFIVREGRRARNHCAI